jgi:hypothetical protein
MTSRFAARQEVFSSKRGIANSGRFILGYVASNESEMHQNKIVTLRINGSEAILPVIDSTQERDAPFKSVSLLSSLRCANIRLCCFKNNREASIRAKTLQLSPRCIKAGEHASLADVRGAGGLRRANLPLHGASEAQGHLTAVGSADDILGPDPEGWSRKSNTDAEVLRRR